LPKSYELPGYLRLALGQAAVDRVPVPAALALAWVRTSPNIHLRTAANRCPVEFSTLFTIRYRDVFGAGLLLPKNKTKLKFVYQPASSALRAFGGLTKTFGEIPDVTALTTPQKKLQNLVHQCTDELAAFSRVVGKDNTAAGKLDGLIHLPTALWPPAARHAMEQLVDGMSGERATMPLDDLLNQLGGLEQTLTRDKAAALARSLETFHVGLEPNVAAGAKLPAGSSPVVLFTLSENTPSRADSASYQLASLTLQLASAVARADGHFSKEEIDHLRQEIVAWTHLEPHETKRLQAHLDWLIVTPVSLASLKTKFAPLSVPVREAIASSMATLTQADGATSPEEIKFLEKVYKALDVDTKRVYSDVHSADNTRMSQRQSTTSGFSLDQNRIEALQRDTERVSALLADIFKEDAADEGAPVEPDSTAEADGPEATGQLWGMDEVHSAFAHLLLSRPSWTRSELEDAASDLGLMLDGALDRINEASYDANDLPLTEGEDPLEISTGVADMMGA
jgi:uncharacterized tellurite resistance protein B-like protein